MRAHGARFASRADMGEPFVFHFKAGDLGQPQVMYIADLSCACTLCGHPQLQRFYHATDFHSLTWSSLHTLARALPQKVDYTCENCGTPSTVDFVQHVVLIHGSPDHLFELTMMAPVEAGEVGSWTYRVTPHRRLDPQVQPVFQMPEDAQHVHRDLSHETFQALTGRVLNIKRGVLGVVRASASQASAAWAQLAPGVWVVAAQGSGQLEDALTLLESDALATHLHDLVSYSLIESEPSSLATHDYPHAMHGRWTSWFDPSTRDALLAGECLIEVLVSEQEAIDAMAYTFETARLSFELVDDPEHGQTFERISTPRGETFARAVIVDDLLRRAVHTGITPGEAGRLTGEEIVGLLLGVWHE